jgi:ubiquinone/menaquinone biosynthesis C-methylase UbiE
MQTTPGVPELKQATEYKARGTNPNRLKAIKSHAGKSILDVGCGSGAYVKALQGQYQMSGVDWFDYENWKTEPEHYSKINDSLLEKYKPGQFETVTCFETLEHLKDPLATLKEIHTICSKNVILTVPNCDITEGMKRSNLIFSHWIDPTHIKFFNLQSITDLVKEAGFTVVESKLTNELNLWPLIKEAYGINAGGLKEKIIRRLLARGVNKKYYITSLVVATK